MSGTQATFERVSATQQSGYAGRSPKIEVRQVAVDRWELTAYLGQKNTGGYSIRIADARHHGTSLWLHADVASPPSGAITAQVITSPAATVGMGLRPDEIVLLDQNGAELARWTP